MYSVYYQNTTWKFPIQLLASDETPVIYDDSKDWVITLYGKKNINDTVNAFDAAYQINDEDTAIWIAVVPDADTTAEKIPVGIYTVFVLIHTDTDDIEAQPFKIEVKKR